ncbi:hypothetical protein [Aliivibrio fischeri]|uniref:hypothetical protein n=1 Tax=Aliivibrio fischeri TaxID=668 RepID=UPI00080E53A4|nr:hypothetical protein [Aliivibrio fischeri]OCH48165.1 hypothetical protein A6E02_08540 [Aliivibrio fischeri]
MKKVITISILIASLFNIYPSMANDNDYTLTKGTAGELIFTPKVINGGGGDGIGGGNDDANDLNNYYQLGSVNGLTEAKHQCNTLDIDNKKWSLLTLNKVDELVAQGKDVDPNLLAFFENAQADSTIPGLKVNKFWVLSTEKWLPNHPNDTINIANFNGEFTATGFFQYMPLSLPENLEGSVVCINK